MWLSASEIPIRGGRCYGLNSVNNIVFNSLAYGFTEALRRGGASRHNMGWTRKRSEQKFGVWGLTPRKFFGTTPFRVPENALSSAEKRPFLDKMKDNILILAEMKQSMKSKKLNDNEIINLRCNINKTPLQY